MDDSPEVELRKLCCTCLSRDRKLFQLCRLTDGVNNLYSLLSFDSEAYREGFYKDTASLYICWECRAVMCRITRFRKQACAAQKELTSIADGRTHIQTRSLSSLTTYHKTTYQKIISESNNTSTDNFIDCGLTTDIKSESEEDIPLSELHSNWLSDNDTDMAVQTIDYKDELSNTTIEYKDELSNTTIEYKDELSNTAVDYKEDLVYKLKKKNKKKKSLFSTSLVNDRELEEIRSRKKMEDSFVNAKFKCDSCIEVFGSEEELNEHDSSLHVEKPDHLQCDICLVYTSLTSYQDHRESHYHRHVCQLCVYIAYNINDMLSHLRSGHAMKNLVLPFKRKKSRHKTEVANLGSKPPRKPSMMDKRTLYGYLCTECNKYFDNKNQRWKHVQRHHREGYKCATCGKRFAFKNNLTRHELLHKGPPPREECAVCRKMVRVDLVKVHARIHADRQRFSCVECAKCFVSRASYEHHLKYTQAHAQSDLLKYKCTTCDKGYRSRGELRDHVNYQHMGKTQHKCPVCGKALATRRCVTRHMRRAHDGVKESARDKICQQCGKAFRDKKGLREHELIHTGERPLSCEICGCTFRQSASLYTHRKRVHKIYTSAKKITLLE